MHTNSEGHRDLFIVVVISVLLDVYILRNSLTMGLVQSADWPIPILSIKFLYYFIVPAWSFQNMGTNGLNIFLALYGLSASVSHNPALIQKFFYFIPWALSPVSAFMLLKKIGIRKFSLIFLSILYQFGPWINGQFMDGEPVNVILYLFIPLVLYVVLQYQYSPRRLFIYLTLGMMIPSFFTLESTFFYVFIVFPVFLYLVLSKKLYEGLKMVLFSALSFFTIILFNIYSITPYIRGFDEVSTTGSTLVSSFTQFPPAVAERYWMIAFLAVSWASLYFLKRAKNSDDWRKLLWFCVVSTLLVSIYPGLGATDVGIYLLSHFPLLAPFINPNEFLLYTWITLFLAISFVLSSTSLSQHYQSGRGIKFSFRRLKHPIFVVAAIGISLLLTSSAVVEIQSFGSHDTGIYLLTQGTHFQKTEVQPQYVGLYDFLMSHNTSFGLSYHTIIFPENPNYSLPYYIGQQMIPGYIGLFNSNVANQVINGINNNDSNFLMLLSVIGVKYLAVIDISGSTWSGTHGQPQLSMWGPNYIFVGKYSYYLQDLEKLSGLKMVQQSKGLWIFQNLYYESAVLSAKSEYFSDIYQGNYLDLLNATSLSGNIIRNNHFNYSGSNFSVIKNLSFSISKDSNVIFANSYVSLSPNSTYLFSFNFNTTGTLNTCYGNGLNGGMVFYNVKPTYKHVTGGTVITINPERYSNGTYRYIFSTQNFKADIPAKVVLQLQPPLLHDTINVSISNVSIEKINGSNMFFDIFKPVKTEDIGPTSFFLRNVTTGNQISIDQAFGTGWVLEYSNGVKAVGVQGTLGQISFNATLSGNVALSYAAQAQYTILSYISFGSIAIFLVFIAVLVVERRLKL